MSKKQSLLVLGVWLMILPLLGFPAAWRTFLLVLTGIILIVAYVYQKSYGKECTCGVEKEKVHGEVFVDNRERVPTQQS